MDKEVKEFSKGKKLFGKPRHAKRDKRIVENPFYICTEFVSGIESGLEKLKIIDEDQEKTIAE